MLRREVEHATTSMTDIPSIIENSVEGDPIRVLPELARGAAMLVVGRHRGGLAWQALLGSVSAACVRHATGPVVVIPAMVASREQASSAERSAQLAKHGVDQDRHSGGDWPMASWFCAGGGMMVAGMWGACALLTAPKVPLRRAS
jgi:hypothetical protein